MKQELYTLTQILSIAVLLLFSLNGNAQIPFNCDYNAYLFQYNDVYAIDLASGNSFQVAADITPGDINATGYNPADGYIWGSLKTPAKTIVRIGKDFSTTSFYIDELPTSNRYVGDVSAAGIYYLKGGGTTYYKIDLNPASPNYGEHQSTETMSQGLSIHDWAFNAVDNQLYAVEKNTNVLYRINPDNGVVTSLGEVPILAGNTYTYGAVYFDVDGRFYISSNQTGTVYVIQNVQNVTSPIDIDSNLFAFGPSSASNDGARCPTAPVIQEICDNGVDDDGDGLIDCEDPSCSGYGSCAVIVPPTSGGNEGGLESNNRLSEQINKRNFNRAKTGYSFNRATAARVERSLVYAQRDGDNNFTLEDFIPLEIIGETETVNTTPTDLLNITNATEIFAVDYMENNIPVASIMAMKTENGVYEHTKYICDRLLGAELVSVSTIEINEKQFIKSIIKNVDGTFEFVLSLSAKVVNNEENFAIESHWNLDQYETDVTFYNFQIWSNSIDDLYLLGKEVLNLLAVEKPISTYNNSTPPTVFVKKGRYINGALDLQIINTNATENVTLDANFRTTETGELTNLNSNLNLGENYITNITVDTGNLFDIGFRIGDGLATPDDLFMSDGPWGIDDSQAGTDVSFYTITANTNDFDATTEFPVERNVELRATTNTYVAAYRALTPRFKAVDLTDYNSFLFTAKGTGNLEITFVKESITDWNAQFKTNIALTDTLEDYVLSIDDLENSFGENPELNDVVTIVFTMASEDGTTMSKIMSLNNLRFSQSNLLSVTDFKDKVNKLAAYPNPMDSKTRVQFFTAQSETVNFVVYNQLGKKLLSKSYEVQAGKNTIIFDRDNLNPGLYICKIEKSETNIEPLKLIIN